MSKDIFYRNECTNELNCRKVIARDTDAIPASSTPFYATRSMFRTYINYKRPLSYKEWLSVDDDKKAAVLYVQFFEQISLAWYKLKTKAAIEEECVSEVLMYLIKNVPIIKEDGSKFSPSYIYKVCYNCIYCKSIDPYKGQTAKSSWYNNTCSQYIKSGEDELDLFDTVASNEDIDEVLAREHFWDTIESMGEDTVKLVEQIINSGRLPSRIGKHRAEIIESLKVALVSYKEAVCGE